MITRSLTYVRREFYMKNFNVNVYTEDETLMSFDLEVRDLDTAMTVAMTRVNQDSTINFYRKNEQRLMITISAADGSESATQML